MGVLESKPVLSLCPEAFFLQVRISGKDFSRIFIMFLGEFVMHEDEPMRVLEIFFGLLYCSTFIFGLSVS